MITSCVNTMNECLHTVQIAQSAITQCTELSLKLSEPENHIAHAIAVFCELALGISSALIADPLSWRRVVSSPSNNDPDKAVKTQDLLTQAKEIGIVTYWINWLLTLEVKNFRLVRFLTLYAFPGATWLISILVLVALSFPVQVEKWYQISIIGYFFIALSAFLVSLATAAFQKAGYDTAGKVNNTLTMEV